MDIRRTRTCERCRNVVPLEKVRLVPKNNEVNMLVCDACVQELRNAPQSRITNAQSRYVSSTPTKVVNAAPPMTQKKYSWSSQRVGALPTPDYATYSCAHCNYTFRLDRAKAGLTYGAKCPYCGRTDKIKLKRD
jgi:DNA-directed RNA polymerase subunit RPC12/RpoP